ncbi:transport protein SEC31, partial [Trifolium pratense]
VEWLLTDPELPLVAEYPSSDGFNRLSWARNGSSSEGFSLGLVAGELFVETLISGILSL